MMKPTQRPTLARCLAIALALILAHAAATPARAAQPHDTFRLPLDDREQAVRLHLEELVSPEGEAEAFGEVDGGVGVDTRVVQFDGGAYELVVQITNRSDRRRFLRSTAHAPVPFEEYRWWNGYLDNVQIQFDPDDVSLSVWFPANAALGAERGLALGVNPMRAYSRIESGRIEGAGGRENLALGLPFVLEPSGADNGLDVKEVSFIVTALPARYGGRDVVQRFYDLFPEAYQPAEGIHPGVTSTQSSYLFRNPSSHMDGEYLADLARRFTGGRGAWEWWYAPFMRGGDWATTYEWTEGWRNYSRDRIDRHRERLRERLEAVKPYDVAPMYYVNILDGEHELVEEHFADAIEVEDPRRRTPWRQETISRVYPGPNDYGELFREGLRRIAEDYPAARGVAWDSVFGHQTVWEEVAGVVDTPGRSFEEGRIFALQAAAYAPLLDLNRGLEAEGYRFANAVNLKLVSPYYLGTRTDAHLYEGAPMERPERLMRIESMRARLGTGKPMTWHRTLLPGRMNWIDWETLDDDEVEAAFRQVDEAQVLLSYFWGANFMPRALGSERAVAAVPELIDLSRQGWQPSPAVDSPEHVLIGRYGQGLGARIAVINPDFDEVDAELSFPREYWDDAHLLLAREDGRALEYVLEPQGASMTLNVPAREVIVLRVVGLATGDDGDGARVRATHRHAPGGDWRWTFSLMTHDRFSWDAEFFRHERAGVAEARGEGQRSGERGEDEPVTLTLDSGDWSVDEQANNQRVGTLHVHQQPRVAVEPDADAVRALSPVPDDDDTPGLALVLADDASEAREQAAERVREWFHFYTHHVTQRFYEPETLAAPSADRPAVRFVVGDDAALASHQRAAVVLAEENVIEVHARDEGDALRKGVLAFLDLMDRAYPYYGVLGHRDDEHFERAGLVGETLYRRPLEGPVVEPTLLDYLRDTGVIE